MKKLNIFTKVIFFCFLAVTIMCSRKDMVLLEVDGSKYTIADFKERISFNPTDDSLKRANLFNDYVNIILVVEAGKSRGYEKDSFVLHSLENHKKEVIARKYYQDKIASKVKVSDIEIHQQYEKMIDQYHLAQIVVASESLAQFLEHQLDQGVVFDSLLQYSLDTITADGDIGEFNALMLPEEILKPLSKISEGGNTKAVKFGDYYYIFKLIEHKTLDTPSFEQVKENIKTQMLNEISSEKAEEIVTKLLKNAKIEYNDEGIAALIKPDSLFTSEDVNKWVVKRNDTSYVYVHTIRDAVLYQYRRSGMDPKILIERVLIPDLIYEEALKEFYDKKTEVKRQLRNALATLIYQKVYNEEVINRLSIDSLEVVLYYKDNQDRYPDKKLEECFSIVKSELREQKIKLLREALFENVRKQYAYEVNEAAYNSILEEVK